MIVNYSDVHKALADMALEVREPATCKNVLIEALSAAHHLCDQYDLSYEKALAEAADLYRYQRKRDLDNLVPKE
jgi:hypothetical protein